MRKIVGVDPGDVHTGVALYRYDPDGRTFQPLDSWESPPDVFEDWIDYHIGEISQVVIEEWRLFPHLAAAQAGSDMRASQCIGAIRATARRAAVPVVMQPPTIKTPARSWARRHGYVLEAEAREIPGDHASDAELHLLRFFLERGYTLNEWKEN